MSRRITSPYLMKQAFPAGLGEEMNQDGAEPLRARAEAVVDVVFSPRLVRPVNQQRLPFDVIARQEAPVAAVLRVVAIVPHDEVMVRWDRPRAVVLPHVQRRYLLVLVRRRRQEMDVGLI